MPTQYPAELKTRALRLLADHLENNPDTGIYTHLPKHRRTPRHRPRNSAKMAQTSRNRCWQHPRHHHRYGSRKPAPAQRKRRVEANQRNPAHRLSFFRSRTAPPSPIMIRYIDRYRNRFGVENICIALQENLAGGFITSRGYRAAKARVPAARTLKDQLLIPELMKIH